MINNSSVTSVSLIKVAMLFVMVGFILKGFAIFALDINWDTNYYLNIGSNYLERGELTPYMWRLGADTTIIAGSGTGYGIYLLNIWFQIFGLSLYSGYILMYILGVLSLIVLYFLSRSWWQSEVAGLITITFISLTGIFIAIYYIRMDAPAILAYSLVLYLHLYAVRNQRIWLHFGVGVAVILITEIHIQSLLYIAAISFYYAWKYIGTLLTKRQIVLFTPSVAFFAGAFFAGVIYLIIHVLPDPQAYFIIAQECPNCTPAGILKELQRYLTFIYSYNAELLVVAVALVISVMRRSEADQHLLLLFIGYVIAQAIINPPAQTEYLAHMLPLLGLCVGGAFEKSGNSETTISRLQLTLFTVVATYLTVGHIFVLTINLANLTEKEEGLTYIQTYIPEDTVVMGRPNVYYELLNYPNFMSYNSGERYGIILRDEDYATFYNRERPAVYLGEPNFDDQNLWTYFNNNDFHQVREDVWVSQELLDSLGANVPEPTLNFSVSQTQIEFGDCVTLEWHVDNADTIFIQDDAVSPIGTRNVCPPTTLPYTVSIYWLKGIITETILIEVN